MESFDNRFTPQVDFNLDDVSAIVCVIAKRGVLVECYNLKNILGSPPHRFESCRRIKMFGSTSENEEKHSIFYVQFASIVGVIIF